MASPISNTDCPFRLDYAAAIKAPASGFWLVNQLCVNPAVAHEVIAMMHTAPAVDTDARRRRWPL